jgi:hypothetical protein
MMEKWNFFGGLFLAHVWIPPVQAEEVFGEDSCGLRDFL